MKRIKIHLQKVAKQGIVLSEVGMKKILLLLIALALTTVMLVACNNPSAVPELQAPTELPPQEAPQLPELPVPGVLELPEQIPAPPIDPTGVWGEALEEYLAQFLPIFHNARYREPVEWRPWKWWESDWEDFVEWHDGDWWLQENQGYGYTYFYRNPITGERILIDDVPYLNQRSGIWYDEDGENHVWSITEIATGFDVFYLDGSNIPYLVIYWDWPQGEGAQSATLHRFQNGAFEFVKELSAGMSIGFYRAADGRLFIDYRSTVAHMLEMRLLHLNDEISIEPVLSTDGWTGTLYNHLTGEYFLQYADGSMRWEGLSPGNRRENMLGMPLTQIEPLEDLKTQLIENISAQLRAEGLVR